VTGTRIFTGPRIANPRLPMVGGVVALYDGLITNGGYAQASYVDGWNRTDGYEVEAVFRTPTTAQGYEVARRYLDGKGWFLRVTAAGDIALSTGYGTNTALTAYATTSAPLKDTWGGKLIGLRIRVDTTAKKLRRWLALDAGTTWSEIGTGSTIGDADAAKGVQATLAPLIVPSGATAQNGVPHVRSIALRALSGDSIIGVTFGTTWPPYTPTYQSPSGSTWSLVGAAVIGSTTVPNPS
jgi:hypothetical protein